MAVTFDKSAFTTVSIDRRDSILIIRLNRPDDANCLDPVMGAEFVAISNHCDSDTSIKAVVMTGTGRFFCAGGDVKAMAAFGDDVATGIKSMADDLHRAISTFTRMRAPLIVAVNGVAAGAGFSLAVSADLVVAGDASSFVMAYTNAGLSPDGSSSYFLPRLIGLRKTQELMFTNKKLSAKEALQWGLINKVVPAGTELDEALQLAAIFAAGSADSNAMVKKLLLDTFGNSLETQMELEGRGITQCAASPNGREGVGAFLEKRRPLFD